MDMCWGFNTLAIQKAMEQAGSNNFRQNFVKTWHFMYSSWGSGLSYCRPSVTSVEFVVAPEASTNEKRDSEFVWQVCDSCLIGIYTRQNTRFDSIDLNSWPTS